MQPAIISVGQYLDLVNDALRAVPSDLLIEGEVSDYRLSQGKWVSFDLKDEQDGSILKCFMTSWQLTFPLVDGMRVRATGISKVSGRFGKYQLDVKTLEPVGEGALKKAYEDLKKRLAAEGLFDASRKRALVRFPERIGLITSRDAAAYTDFLRIANNRWSGITLMHAHVHVQGREAVSEIVAAFQAFAALPAPERPDAIALVRGGGGLEDLHAFNDERVARAIYASVIPVVVGVGHERDESLADYVADVRASTPSNAAERLVPSREEVLFEIGMMVRHMEECLSQEVSRGVRLVERAARAAEPLLSRERARLNTLTRDLLTQGKVWPGSLRERLTSHVRVLSQLDPKRVLARGYSLVTSKGKIVTSPDTLPPGAEIAIEFARGSLEAEVLRVNGKGKQRLV